MKKFMALLLAVVLTLSLSVTAFAANIAEDVKTKDAPERVIETDKDICSGCDIECHLKPCLDSTMGGSWGGVGIVAYANFNHNDLPSNDPSITEKRKADACSYLPAGHIAA